MNEDNIMSYNQEEITFSYVIPIERVTNERVAALNSRFWKLELFSLHLLLAVIIPEEVKNAKSATFGYCNTHGVMCSFNQATHFGWSVHQK